MRMDRKPKKPEKPDKNIMQDIEYFEIPTEKYGKTRMERKTIKYEIKR